MLRRLPVKPVEVEPTSKKSSEEETGHALTSLCSRVGYVGPSA